MLDLSMQPDVVFCHGPFLQGDYRMAQTLLNESAAIISFADATPGSDIPPPATPSAIAAAQTVNHHLSDYLKTGQESLTGWAQQHGLSRSKTPSPKPPQAEPLLLPQAPTDVVPPVTAPSITTPEPSATPLRRMLITVVGISPHRKLWATSARPSESVINYTLLNGCPAIVVPVKLGCPLMAWDTMTLHALHKIGEVEGPKFEGVVNVLYEYASLCVDWERYIFPDSLERGEGTTPGKSKREVAEELTKNAITLLVAAAIRSKTSKEATKHIDDDRAGIVFLRLP